MTGQLIGETEIDYFDLRTARSCCQHDVLHLEVAVRHALGVQVGQRAQHLADNVACVVLGVRATLQNSSQKVRAMQQFCDDVEVVGCVEVLTVLEQVGVVQLLQDVDFAEEELALRLLGHYLAGPLFTCRAINSQAHGGESAAAKHASQTVTLLEAILGVFVVLGGGSEELAQAPGGGRSLIKLDVLPRLCVIENTHAVLL
mmetsp:Transcript_41878/g.75208  ORF Transcript_41878/g.75208 Transcript_41878/m.75208 type:complete len:201 (-) Transcript_41878:106-708(-)